MQDKGKDLLLSNTTGGILLLLLAPYLSQWGVTPAESDTVIQLIGAVWAIVGRMIATRPITSIAKIKLPETATNSNTLPAILIGCCALVLVACAGGQTKIDDAINDIQREVYRAVDAGYIKQADADEFLRQISTGAKTLQDVQRQIEALRQLQQQRTTGG